jgi:hypothetical protein
MNPSTCPAPLELGELAGYLLGELSAESADRVEEHYFACAHCARRLEGVRALGTGVRQLLLGGQLSVAATDALVGQAGAQGMSLRTYRLAPGDQVACTAAPGDDFVVIRLGLVVGPEESVDLTAEAMDLDAGHTESLIRDGVSVDRAAGEIVYLYSAELVRSLPKTRWTLHARVQGPAGTRTVGPYVLNHTPWEQLGGGAGA